MTNGNVFIMMRDRRRLGRRFTERIIYYYYNIRQKWVFKRPGAHTRYIKSFVEIKHTYTHMPIKTTLTHSGLRT